MGIWNPTPPPPPHESNLLWGPLSLGCASVLTVVGATKHDLRWLLVAAWLLFIVAAAVIGRGRGRWRWPITVLSAAIVGAGLLWLNHWLRPEAPPQPTSQGTNVTTDSNSQESGQVAALSKTRSVPKVKTREGPPALSPTQESSPKTQPSAMQQNCGGGNCAQSNGQQGGITAGQINIGTPPPPEVQLISMYRNRPHTYVQEGLTRTVMQGFESKYKIQIVGQQVPEVEVQVRHPTFIHMDCDRMVNRMGDGTGASGSGIVSCSVQNVYDSVGVITIFTTTELPEAMDFLGYRCVGTPCRALKPLESE